MKTQKALNFYTSKAVAALIWAGYWDIKFNCYSNFATVNVIEYPFIKGSEIKIFENGDMQLLSGYELIEELRYTNKKDFIYSLTH